MADWLKLIDRLNYANSVYQGFKPVRDLQKLASKTGSRLKGKKKGDVTAADLAPFSSYSRNAFRSQKLMKTAARRVKAANSGSPVFPQTDFSADYGRIFEVARKHGAKSKEVQKALAKLHITVLRNHQRMTRVKGIIEATAEKLERNTAQAEAVISHSAACVASLKILISAPWMGGTGQNASFFSMMRGVEDVSREAVGLKTELGRAIAASRKHMDRWAEKFEEVDGFLKMMDKTDYGAFEEADAE